MLSFTRAERKYWPIEAIEIAPSTLVESVSGGDHALIIANDLVSLL